MSLTDTLAKLLNLDLSAEGLASLKAADAGAAAEQAADQVRSDAENFLRKFKTGLLPDLESCLARAKKLAGRGYRVLVPTALFDVPPLMTMPLAAIDTMLEGCRTVLSRFDVPSLTLLAAASYTWDVADRVLKLYEDETKLAIVKQTGALASESRIEPLSFYMMVLDRSLTTYGLSPAVIAAVKAHRPTV